MIFEFLKENYALILSIILIILDLVVIPCISKSGSKANKDNKFYKIIEKLPEYICQAESMFTKGSNKLNFVLQKIHLDCIEKKIEFDEELFQSYIEEILETPQKK